MEKNWFVNATQKLSSEIDIYLLCCNSIYFLISHKEKQYK